MFIVNKTAILYTKHKIAIPSIVANLFKKKKRKLKEKNVSKTKNQGEKNLKHLTFLKALHGHGMFLCNGDVGSQVQGQPAYSAPGADRVYSRAQQWLIGPMGSEPQPSNQ